MNALRAPLCLFVLVASNSGACELASTAALRKDVEDAFVSKSFAQLVDKYGDKHPVQLVLENEYDEENPTLYRLFDSVSAFSTWFVKMHDHSDNMFIPSPVTCGIGTCRYQQPQLTMHHGYYLLGFESERREGCTLLTKVHIQWG
jgi:hypothetical protein